MINLILISLLLLSACSGEKHEEIITKEENPKTEQITTQKIEVDTSSKNSQVELAKEIKFEVLTQLPHSTNSFTQGLIYYKGYLYESTGQYGSSSIRKLDPKTGAVLKQKNLPINYFGEGISIYDNKIYMLTWQNQVCLVFDINTFDQVDEHDYRGEGWGLIHDGEKFILSDGTNMLRYFDNNFSPKGSLSVNKDNIPLNMINELEFINGNIWANVWQQDYIVIIDKNSGKVKSQLNCKFLWDSLKDKSHSDVLNGIAYDKSSDTYYITGKNWESIFVGKIK